MMNAPFRVAAGFAVSVFASGIIATAQSRAHVQRPCLRFEPSVASVVGRLVRKTLPGPPNYESISKGDTPETYWFVTLDNPVCVSGTPGDEFNSEDVASVTTMQLVLMHDEYRTHSLLVGKRVKARGTLFTALTGHHHTKVLMTVEHLDLERR